MPIQTQRWKQWIPVTELLLVIGCSVGLAEDAAWQKAVDDGNHVREQSGHSEAEQAYLAAIDEAERFAPTDPRLALSQYQLAALYHATGRFREAEPLYRQALLIWEKVHGADLNVAAQLERPGTALRGAGELPCRGAAAPTGPEHPGKEGGG
jgi:tetratricopeptide (TPR) repeat protein